MIRAATADDLPAVLELYQELFPDEDYGNSAVFRKNWISMLSDDKITCILAEDGEQPVSTCTIIIVPNLTHGQQPFALLENMVTHSRYRNMGYGRAVINKAIDIAREEHCYKVMLLSGSARTGAHKFYEKLGFSGESKHGFEMRFR